MNYLIIDIQTTGDDPSWHEIVHISARLCKENWEAVDDFHSLIYPNDEDAFNLLAKLNTPIEISDLKEAPMMHEVLESFDSWLLRALGIKKDASGEESDFDQVVLCGHQFVNTFSFLRMAFGEENKEWSFSGAYLDLSALTHLFYKMKKMQKYYFSTKLGSIAKALDLQYDESLDWQSERVDLVNRTFKALNSEFKINE